MTPKYQIFISSTYEDLKDEREQVIKSILKLGHIPIGMEMFNAANQTQWELIKRRIEESDYYIVIVAQRYGSIIKEENGISYTEKEYDYANSLGIPTYGFVLAEDALWPGNRRDVDEDAIEKQASLKRFIQKIQTKMRAPWSNKDQLASAVTSSLSENTVAFPRTGWVRADQVLTSETANEIARLSKENADLRERLAQLSIFSTPMPEIEAELDVGKFQYPWYGFYKSESDETGGSSSQFSDVYDRRAMCLRITIVNRGNLATSLTVRMKCNALIMSDYDLDAFNSRMPILGVFAKKSYTWSSITIDEINKSSSFIAELDSLKPSEHHFLCVPLRQDVSVADETDIDLSIHPEIGKHLIKKQLWSELTTGSEN